LQIRPVWGFPSLLIDGDERYLLIADLHLGFEENLRKKGIYIPDQSRDLAMDAVNIARSCDAKKLIVLGDLKERIGSHKRTEERINQAISLWLQFFDRIIVIKGNHDGLLERMVPREVEVVGSQGTVIEGVGLFHGHSWPSDDVLNSRYLIMAHLHPAVLMEDENLRELVRVFVFSRVKLQGRREKKRAIIMPAFNKFLGSALLNKGEVPKNYRGPIFSHGTIDLRESDIFTLDGFYLGRLSDLYIQQ
jgi:putative SbcD/Mre11-related phosphoesterase